MSDELSVAPAPRRSKNGFNNCEDLKLYQKFFGLRQSAFGVNPDPRFLFRMRETEEVLAALTHGIQNRLGFILLTGEAGMGKTTLLNKLLYGLRGQQVPTAFVFNSSLKANEFFDFIMADFGIKCESSMKSQVLMRLNEWLLERHALGKTAVLVVDEAQNLSFDVLEEICMLTNLETYTQKLLQIVLSGQPELEEKIREPRLRQLRQRIAMHAKLRPLTLEETRGYITERLRIVGACGQTIFTPEAVERVHKISGGIPRVINLLCEHALITAYAYERKPVAPDMIEEVAHHFELAPTQPAGQFSSCGLSGGGKREDENAIPPLASTFTATASLGLAMSRSLACNPEQLGQLWARSREGTRENRREVGRGVRPPAKKSDSGVLSGPSTIPSAAINQEPGVASEAVLPPRIPLPRSNDKTNANSIGTGRSIGRAAGHAIGPKPNLSGITVAAGQESRSVELPPLRRVSGTRIGLVGLTLVLSALIGSVFVMRMTSEVHSQSTPGIVTRPVTTSSQPSVKSPPDTITSAPDDARLSSVLDKIFPPATTTSDQSVSTESSQETVGAGPLSRVSGTDRKLSLAMKAESMTGTRASSALPVGPEAKQQMHDRELSTAQRDELNDKIVIGGLFMDRSDYDAAIEAFNAALKIDPSSPEARVGIQQARRARDAQKTSARP